MAEFFVLLQESGLLTAAFIIGAIAVVIAIIGSIKTIIELPPAKALMLALFGLFLMAVSIGGYFISLQTSPKVTEEITQAPLEATLIPTSDATSAIPVVTTENLTPSTPVISGEGGLSLCGEPAFNGNLATQDPLFLRPAGYLSGWISSDPSTIVLPNGTTRTFETQYVLIVEDLSSIQIRGVQRLAGKANTWGCWYSADPANFVAEDAKSDFCIKKAGNSVAVFYRVSESGFEEIGTTATISCP